MTYMNKFLGLLMTLAVTALPLAASAQTKQYGLDVTSSPPPAYPGTGGGSAVQLPSGGGTVYWTISNQTPSGGNSAIQSFVIKKAPGVAISNPAGPAGVVFLLTAGGDLKVSNVGPLVPKQNNGMHQVTISFTLTPQVACAGPTTVWAPTYSVVTTGTFSSTTFLFLDDNGSAQTPTNQTTGFNVCTFAVNGQAQPAAGGQVVCSPNPVNQGSSSTCTATANNGYFLSSFSTAPSANPCVRNATPNANTCTVSNVQAATTVTGNFAQQVGGPVACTPGTSGTDNYAANSGTTPTILDPDGFLFDLGSLDPGDFAIRRGNNQDGTCPTNDPKVGVSITLRPDIAPNAAEFLYDKTLVQNAMFMYTIYWPVGVTPVNGWSIDQPQVLINGVWVSVQKCNSQVLSLAAFPSGADVCVAAHTFLVSPIDGSLLVLIDTFFDKKDVTYRYP